MNTARFLKYVWSFYNIMHERVKAGFCLNPFYATGLFLYPHENMEPLDFYASRWWRKRTTIDRPLIRPEAALISVPTKKCSENVRKIYRRIPLPKCDLHYQKDQKERKELLRWNKKYFSFFWRGIIKGNKKYFLEGESNFMKLACFILS